MLSWNKRDSIIAKQSSPIPIFFLPLQYKQHHKLNRTLYPMLADSDTIFFEGFSVITDEGSIHCRLHLGS